MNDLTPLNPLAEIIRSRRKKALERKETLSLLFTATRTVLILGVFIVLFSFFFMFKIVDGNAMFPALSDGDLTLCFRQSEYIKNDVVFYTVGKKEYVGRVVAKGGDVVDISEDGTLTVNGTAQVGEIVYPTYPPDGWQGVVTVPDNAVFVLGDYRVQTIDSRDFGCIPLNNVEAKLITVIRHRGI